jgi:hypothetical protein
MVINRIHAGPVAFARILAASVEPQRLSLVHPTHPSTGVGRARQPVKRGNHLVKRFHQWHLHALLRSSF